MNLAGIALVAALAGLSPADSPIQDEQALKRAESRFREVAGPLDPDLYAPELLPEYENAATPIMEAALRTPRERVDRSRLLDLSKRPAATWSEHDTEHARRLVLEHGDVLSLLDRAGSRSQSRFPIEYSEGTFANPPPLLRILDAARIAVVDARLARRSGDDARAGLGVERIGGIARALQNEPMLIVFLVGLAAERMQLELASEWLSAASTSEPELSRVESALLDNDPAHQARRAVALDFAALETRIAATPRYEALMADFLDHGSDLIEAAGDDWYLARSALEDVAGAARRCREVDAKDEATRRGITTVHEVLGTWTGPFSRAAATEAGRAVVRLAVEVRRRGLENEGYPDDIRDDPATATPLALTGRPVRVERLDDLSFLVEAEDADAVWVQQHGDDTPAPPFKVILPAITPAVPRESAEAP